MYDVLGSREIDLESGLMTIGRDLARVCDQCVAVRIREFRMTVL